MNSAPQSSSAAAAGGSGGGPAPFLQKTYDMVDDSTTDEIVSWSSDNKSFIVWNPPEFSRVLLPTYFKHNNFSSFIRQLNTYGFRKADPERWEFANEEFIKDQKHLLKNIHRRKPIHSHSHPPGSAVDPERAALEQEIEKLSREKNALQTKLLSYNYLDTEKLQLEDFQRRLDGMEKRQTNLQNFFEKALQDSFIVELLSRKIESMDLAAYNKKRRLPQVDQVQPVAEGSLVDNPSNFRLEFGNVFPHDISNKLRLELSPAVSDMNLISGSTQGSNEDEESLQKNLSEGELTGMQTRTGLAFTPETLDLADTGASFTFNMDSCLSQRATTTECPNLHSLEPSTEEGDSHISCQLNLTLASCTLEFNRNSYSARSPQINCQEIGNLAESRVNADGKESEIGVSSNRNVANEAINLAPPKEASGNVQVKAAARHGVNDVFWENFLTERPGCSDNEEAISNYRAIPNSEQEEGRSVHGISSNIKNMDNLTL
ncbi:putative transcription factor HSF-type-DNA-binding family [Medicago truncatula]|uniref:Heat shock transcription factor A8 n=1 Tax=Medicago truncatula TaxID=3880 RepID=G7LH28_MEDTR|nr:heat stress transcription factor A-5 [Medicago truncatula]AET04087.1 heat shock transcription factor A8 [Medicago truncatula]RHN42547.1 putative transcription factor HSF-type-DNA-binding family [Medicago truncatula]